MTPKKKRKWAAEEKARKEKEIVSEPVKQDESAPAVTKRKTRRRKKA
tara:strand:+ start:1780 stop:1920 length:141 start_codon:yes stop_codon:yes gene_type:complete